MPQLTFTNGAYHTAPLKVSPLRRMFPSISFHVRLIASVLRASSVAKRAGYGDQQWAEHGLCILRALEGVGVQFEITGIQHLQQLNTPCVIAANHNSTLETAVLPAIIQPIIPVTFIVKQSLIDYPVFKHLMRARDFIPVTQTDPRRDLKTMLLEGAERLQRGISVVVFPEGRRAPEFDHARFNTSAVKLAHRAEAPIVPLALSTNAWALGRGRFNDFGRINPDEKVRFAFGPPIPIDGRGVNENAAVISYITEHLVKWRSEDEGEKGVSANRLLQA